MADSNERNSSRMSDRRLVGRLLRYLYPYKWSVLAAAALTILNAPLATAGPLLTKTAIDLFLAPDSSKPLIGYVLWLKHGADFVGLGGSMHQGLIFIAVLFLLANLAQSVIHYLQVVITERVGQMAIHDLRLEMFVQLQKVAIHFHDRHPVGQVMTRLTADVDALNEVFSSGMTTLVSQAAIALYVAAWMFRIDWALALITCGVLFAMLVFTSWLRRIARPTFHWFRQRIAIMNAFLQEHLTGMQIIQIFTREPEEMRRFELLNREHWRSATAATVRNALFYPAIETLTFTGIALIIWYGGLQVMGEIIGLGTLVAFVQLAQSFYDPVMEIGSRYHTFQGALTCSERIFELLDEPVAIASSENPVQLGSVRGRIEFRNVWFAYNPGDWILKGVSFIVEPGEKVALVGHTGAGKTTITNLLVRFYEIQRGQILLDGTDIRQIDPMQLRSNFAIVLQDIFLFSTDINSNIRLGNHSISEAKVKIAAREIHLDEFVTGLERGYESHVLERGASLSAGQKQLIGFARALAFDRPVLILDEATSSIDSRTESQIRAAIQKVMVGRTALVIAHRLSTIQSVDRILVLHKGEIRESGNHKSLLALHGLYCRLHQLQIGCRPTTKGTAASSTAAQLDTR
jgi:ATP-binding cassette subfamily B multidrug efflux pump